VTLIWTIVTPEPDLVLFWLMEIIIVGAMVFDVAVRIMAQGAFLFFRYWANWYVIPDQAAMMALCTFQSISD
jgi:hypothetical protein